MISAIFALLACTSEPAASEDTDAGVDSAEETAAPVDTGTPFDQIDPSTLDAGPNPCRPAQRVRVGRVIDGDTFEVSGGSLDGQSIRIIGLNTPEIGYGGTPDECWAQEAKAFAQDVLEGRDVWLTFDDQCTDNYARTLAYVYTGTLHQGNYTVRALETGQGYVLSIAPNNTFDQQFRAAQTVAREAVVGVWATCR